MSKLDELLQNIFEYKNLLSFLNKNYPEVLQEWDIMTELNKHSQGSRTPNQMVSTEPQQTAKATNQRTKEVSMT